MVKVYKLKYNLPTFWAGDICVLDENGDLWWYGNPDPEINKKEKELHWREKVCMYHAKTIEKFNILPTYFEEVKDTSKFWPFEGCRYYFVLDTGVDWDIWNENPADYDRKSMGNCFLNEEDANEAWEEIRAICSLKRLGSKLTTFQINVKDGRVMMTMDTLPEYHQKVSDNLRVFLGDK